MRGGEGKRACEAGTGPDVGATPHDSGGVPPAASARRGARWADSRRVARGANRVPLLAHGVRPPAREPLLELDGGACLLELGLDRVGLLLVHAPLDRLRSRVDEILRLLET